MSDHPMSIHPPPRDSPNILRRTMDSPGSGAPVGARPRPAPPQGCRVGVSTGAPLPSLDPCARESQFPLHLCCTLSCKLVTWVFRHLPTRGWPCPPPRRHRLLGVVCSPELAPHAFFLSQITWDSRSLYGGCATSLTHFHSSFGFYKNSRVCAVPERWGRAGPGHSASLH